MSDSLPNDNILFEVETPLGFPVRTTVDYWEIITTIKHPALRGREKDVQTALSNQVIPMKCELAKVMVKSICFIVQMGLLAGFVQLPNG